MSTAVEVECHSVDGDSGMASGSEERSTWEPGDPLYRGRSGFGGYFYNFRDPYQSELNPDACDCGDAASWPEPKFNRRLPEDPLAKFIAEYHQQKKEESSG